MNYDYIQYIYIYNLIRLNVLVEDSPPQRHPPPLSSYALVFGLFQV